MKEWHARWGAGLGVVAAALVLSASANGAATATTFTVSGFADGSGSCTAPDGNGNSVCSTLRAAANRARLQANLATIELQAGTYQLTLGQLVVGASTIQGTGPGGSGGTIIQQTDSQNRVIEVQSGPAKLADLEITGGHLAPSSWQTATTWLGGGVLAQAPLVLQDVLVTDNAVLAPDGPSPGDDGDGAEGGGIAYAPGTAAGSALSGSVITGNSATGGQGATGGAAAGGNAYGGGIAYEGNGPLSVQDTTVAQNTATGGAGGGGGQGGDARGGGIFNPGELTLEATTITANTATGGAQGAPASPSTSGGMGSGGGIFSGNSSDTIVNTTVFGNTGQGGAGADGGSPGDGSGGGIFEDGTGSLSLQSDTIDANQASTAAGNLDVALAQGSLTIRDTIVATGSPDDCDIAVTFSSESYNLEDDAADTCGFAAANHDLVGTNPQLPSALGNYGGPTQTLAPTPGSPVLGAGGQCLDPTSTPPNQPLSVDQRNLPRANPCDVGAFEGQPPANTTTPTFAGQLTRGSTLVCSPGTWTGDGPLTYSFGWLNNGVPIPGATTNTYVVRAVDAGQGLACQVTATYYGSRTAASPFRMTPSFPVITLLGVSVKKSLITVNLGCRGPDGRRCNGGLTESVLEKRRGGKAISLRTGGGPLSVSLGEQGYSIATRHVAAIHLYLRRNVKRLLKRFRRIPSLLTVTQTTALGTGVVTSRHVRIRRPRVRRGT